jgi:hypothetical protein
MRNNKWHSATSVTTNVKLKKEKRDCAEPVSAKMAG